VTTAYRSAAIGEDRSGFSWPRRSTARIQRAVETILAAGRVATPDIGGSATTQKVGDAIAATL